MSKLKIFLWLAGPEGAEAFQWLMTGIEQGWPVSVEGICFISDDPAALEIESIAMVKEIPVFDESTVVVGKVDLGLILGFWLPLKTVERKICRLGILQWQGLSVKRWREWLRVWADHDIVTSSIKYPSGLGVIPDRR